MTINQPAEPASERPAEAWLAEKAGEDVAYINHRQQVEGDGAAEWECVGSCCYEVSVLNRIVHESEWMLVHERHGSGLIDVRPIPTPRYSPAEAWTVLTWLAKAGYTVEFFELGKLRDGTARVRAVVRDGPRDFCGPGIHTGYEAALAAALAALHRQAEEA